MSWKEFDNNHNYQKKVILIVSGLLIGCLLVIILFMTGSKAYFVMKNAPQLNEKLLKKDICYHAFNSISLKRGNPLVVDKRYLRTIEGLDYSFIDYKISYEQYRIIKETGNDTCKIVIAAETQNTHALRSFHIKLIKDSSYPFEYKVHDIGEILLSESDLKETK